MLFEEAAKAPDIHAMLVARFRCLRHVFMRRANMVNNLHAGRWEARAFCRQMDLSAKNTHEGRWQNRHGRPKLDNVSTPFFGPLFAACHLALHLFLTSVRCKMWRIVAHYARKTNKQSMSACFFFGRFYLSLESLYVWPCQTTPWMHEDRWQQRSGLWQKRVEDGTARGTQGQGAGQGCRQDGVWPGFTLPLNNDGTVPELRPSSTAAYRPPTWGRRAQPGALGSPTPSAVSSLSIDFFL